MWYGHYEIDSSEYVCWDEEYARIPKGIKIDTWLQEEEGTDDILVDYIERTYL